MTNEKGDIQPVFISGQKTMFKIYYECKIKVSSLNLSVAISFTNSEGLLVSVLATDFLNYFIRTGDQKGCIVCLLDKLPFSHGQYSLNIIIRNHGIIEDWIRDAEIINVENGDFFGTGRTVEATHKSLLIDQHWYTE
jgi:lipopolysaccharide transport system ATP-binding protein